MLALRLGWLEQMDPESRPQCAGRTQAMNTQDSRNAAAFLAESMTGKTGMKSGLMRVLPVRYHVDFARTVDGRSLLGRAVRDRFNSLVQDLGGPDHLSHQERSMCMRATWLQLLLEHEETRIAEGGGIDIPPHVALVNSLLQVYRALGLKRRAKEVKLADYLRRGES